MMGHSSRSVPNPVHSIQLRFLTAVLLLGCAPERLEAERACPEPHAAEAPDFEHACEHAEVGPFGKLDASRGAVELRNTHMLYTVSLRPGTSGYVGELLFTPRATGRYGIFMAGDFSLVVHDGAEEACQRGVAEQAPCAGLTRAKSYDLVEGPGVELTIVDAPSSTAKLVVELL